MNSDRFFLLNILFFLSGIAMRFSVVLTCYILACCWEKSATTVPEHLVNEFKLTLLPIFGMTDPPKLNASEKVEIPQALKKLYNAQKHLEWDTASLPLPGMLTGSANTVRSYAHVGRYLIIFCSIKDAVNMFINSIGTRRDLFELCNCPTFANIIFCCCFWC